MISGTPLVWRPDDLIDWFHDERIMPLFKVPQIALKFPSEGLSLGTMLLWDKKVIATNPWFYVYMTIRCESENAWWRLCNTALLILNKVLLIFPFKSILCCIMMSFVHPWETGILKEVRPKFSQSINNSEKILWSWITYFLSFSSVDEGKDEIIFFVKINFLLQTVSSFSKERRVFLQEIISFNESCYYFLSFWYYREYDLLLFSIFGDELNHR